MNRAVHNDFLRNGSLPLGISSVVVGGGSGLGAETARQIAQRGGKVTVIDANADSASEIAAELGATAVTCDITDGPALQNAWMQVSEAQGVPRFVVNCAGVAPAKRIVGREGAQPLELFRRVIDINLTGSFNVLRVAAAAMMNIEPDDEGERGAILLTASIAAWEGQIGQAAYAASKAGVVGLILPAARELAASGIRVIGIAPGVFETPMVANMPDEVKESLYAGVPFPHRFGRPREFADLALSIWNNQMVNGTTIRLDGANRLGSR